MTKRQRLQDSLRGVLAHDRLLDWDTEERLRRVAGGDAAARGELLEHYRQRLRRAVSLRLDRRVRTRVDPSDVVQEVMAEADRKLSDYIRQRPGALLPLAASPGRGADDPAASPPYTGPTSVASGGKSPKVVALPNESALLLAERLRARTGQPQRRLAGGGTPATITASPGPAA